MRGKLRCYLIAAGGGRTRFVRVCGAVRTGGNHSLNCSVPAVSNLKGFVSFLFVMRCTASGTFLRCIADPGGRCQLHQVGDAA